MPLRPTASTPPTVAPSPRRQRHCLPVLGERRRRARPPLVPAPHRTVISSGTHRSIPAGRRDLSCARRDRAADVPLRAAADARDRVAGADVVGEALSDPRALRHVLQVAAAAPDGQHLGRVGDPSGSNARRSMPWAARSASVNISGMKSRFSSPMPCSPDSTPPAATLTPRRSPRPRRVPARCTPGSRASNTSSGWRFPSPAWKTFMHDRARSARRSRTPARSTSTSLRAGHHRVVQVVVRA